MPTTSRCASRPDRLSSATARIESSWAFHGVICAMWPSNAASGAMPSRSRMPAGSTRSGSKRALSKLLYTWVAKRLVEPGVELARHLARHPEDRAGGVRQHRAHAASQRCLRHVLVGPDHQRRAAQAPGDGAHEARTRRVGVDDVGVEPTRGTSQRRTSGAEAKHVHWRLDRVEAQAGLEAGDETRSTAARSTTLASGPRGDRPRPPGALPAAP